MDRLREPTEFGFTTAPYLPPERRRPLWRTMLCGALLAVIPIVGPGMSAVYVDRRRMPSTFDFGEALKTAIVQAIAVALLALLVTIVLWFVVGLRWHLDLQWTRR